MYKNKTCVQFTLNNHFIGISTLLDTNSGNRSQIVTAYKANRKVHYLKKVNKFSNNVLRLWLVLTIFDIHVQSSFL